jgi:DNA-binding NarL/FixJ family response regulator
MKTPKAPSRKQVFIVEDHPVFADGLCALFNNDPGLRVCGTATNAAQALKEIRRLQPDVLVVDIGLPDRDGFELVREVSAFKRQIPILVVSAGDERLQARKALRLGAKGYVTKQEGPARLLEAVHRVLDGHTSVSPQISQQLLQSLHRRRSAVDPVELLSPRECQVLQLIGEARSGDEIAAQLGISRKTVDTYRASLREKLGVSDGHELIYFAVRWSMSNRRPKPPPDHRAG